MEDHYLRRVGQKEGARWLLDDISEPLSRFWAANHWTSCLYPERTVQVLTVSAVADAPGWEGTLFTLPLKSWTCPGFSEREAAELAQPVLRM